MILGHKPSAYSVSYDKNGNKIEKEFRMCGHCGRHWEYIPKSGKIRGFCLICWCLTCQEPDCVFHGCRGPFRKHAIDAYLPKYRPTQLKFSKKYN